MQSGADFPVQGDAGKQAFSTAPQHPLLFDSIPA
jgi:hypothetical protein